MSNKLMHRLYRKINYIIQENAMLNTLNSIRQNSSSKLSKDNYYRTCKTLDWNTYLIDNKTSITSSNTDNISSSSSSSSNSDDILRDNNLIKDNNDVSDTSINKLHTVINEFEVISFNLLAPVYKRLSTKDTITGYIHLY